VQPVQPVQEEAAPVVDEGTAAPAEEKAAAEKPKGHASVGVLLPAATSTTSVRSVSSVESKTSAPESKPAALQRSTTAWRTVDDSTKPKGFHRSNTGFSILNAKLYDDAPVDSDDDDVSARGSMTNIAEAEETKASVVLNGDDAPMRSSKNMSLEEYKKMLSVGQTFYKHGRKGSPHLRKVWWDEEAGKLCWSKPKASKADKSSMIPIRDILTIKRGKHSAVLKRSVSKKYDDDVCFSIHAVKRTLDLSVDNSDERERWVKGLTQLVEARS